MSLSPTSDFIYHNVPRDIASANNSVCGYMYRTGTLSGQCIEGYYLAVYSYNFECDQCSDELLNSNWGVYVAIAYLPLTVFIIFLFLFRVSVASPKLNTIIFITLTFASPSMIAWRGEVCTSIIDAFVTFFLISTTGLFNVSSQLY